MAVNIDVYTVILQATFVLKDVTQFLVILT